MMPRVLAGTIDIGQLPKILTQAKGPILERQERALPELAEDIKVDVADWLADLERLCRIECCLCRHD